MAYRLVFAAILLVASGLTIADADPHAVVLASVEVAGIVLFVRRRSQFIGAAILLAVFAFAEVLSIQHGHVPTYFLQYAAAAIFIVAMDRRLAGVPPR